MKYIELTQGKRAIVDDADYEWLSQWKWWYSSGGYAMRTPWDRTTHRNQKHIRMHRLINRTPDGFETDHINRNKLDNRRANLKTATSSQNHLNKDIPKNNKSGHIGVGWDNKNGKWRANFQAEGKWRHLGYFDDVAKAVAARRRAEQDYAALLER